MVYQRYHPTSEDRLWRHVITLLTCNGDVQKVRAKEQSDIGFNRHFSAALARLHPVERDGLVPLGADAITGRTPGRPLLRNMASALNAHLHDAALDRQPAYSESA